MEEQNGYAQAISKLAGQSAASTDDAMPRIAALEQEVARERVRRHLAELERQAREFQKTVPGFDLREALRDPEFVTLTSPEIRLSVASAYRALHPDAERNSATAHRPPENGLNDHAGLVAGVNTAALSKSEREDIRRRAARGERITFD